MKGNEMGTITKKNGQASRVKAELESLASSGKTVLKPIRREIITIKIVGKSPLILHSWGEKQRKAMRDKHAGKKTTDRSIRDPDAEGRAACYYLPDGSYGVPALAIKTAIIDAAHKDLGIEKTLVRKSLFIITDNPDKLIALEGEPTFTEDVVRVGQGSADLRYRPYFHEWSCVTEWEMDVDMLQVQDLLTLIDRAGFGVGIGEWRPQKGGEYGRFCVDATFPIVWK